MAGAAIIEGDKLSVHGNDAVDSAAITVPTGSGRSKDNTLPLPIVQVAGDCEARGGDAFTRVEDIKSCMRFFTRVRSRDCNAQQHEEPAAHVINPWILYSFQPKRRGLKSGWAIAGFSFSMLAALSTETHQRPSAGST